METPVSWFLIEPGWRVESADGGELGRVVEVRGDADADVFDGIVVGATLHGPSRYVPSELVGEIIEGHVRLNVDPGPFEHLREADSSFIRRALKRLGLTGPS